MRRFRAFLAIAVALITGILVGIRLFIPWALGAELAFLQASSYASSYGADLQVLRFGDRGVIPTVTMRGLSLNSSMMGNLRCDEVAVRPLIMESVLHWSPTAQLTVSRGVLALPGGVDHRLDGAMTCLLSSGTILLSDVALTGDLSAQGRVSISPERGKILEADMVISVPEDMDGAMTVLSQLFPMKRSPDGTWALSREGGK
ncbi:MAG: hypothetical protein CSA35_04390 [Dethiosulfovibrio peptidovorans]|nr:MAG: hypothetical protein CSA35_04390 [Dethiosulfovibrio peptidovorans]